MKRFRYLLFVVVAMLIFSVVGCGAQTASKSTPSSSGQSATEPIIFKLSFATPENGYYGQIYKYFAKTVEEESKGQIKLQLYPGGSLVSDPQVLDAVMQGNVDIGHFMSSYVDPTVKEITPFQVPGAYVSSKFMEVEKATHPIFERVFNKYNIHYLGAYDTGSSVLAANKKVGNPITTPAQMKGHPVRTAGKWDAETIKLWGGSPVTVPIGDLPNALQLGTINISKTSYSNTDSLKLYEIAPNITVMDLSGFFGGLIMSDKAWQKLNSEQQAAMTRAAVKWIDFNHQLATNSYKDFEDKMKKGGVKLTVLTQEQNAAFAEATAQVMEQVKAIAGPEGAEFIKIIQSIK